MFYSIIPYFIYKNNSYNFLHYVWDTSKSANATGIPPLARILSILNPGRLKI